MNRTCERDRSAHGPSSPQERTIHRFRPALQSVPRRVQRFLWPLDAPVDCLLEDSEFSVQLANARIQPNKGVDVQIPLSERDRRVLEDRAGFVVERLATILTQISLRHPIAAVPNRGLGTAARAIDAVTPVNLCQQIRGPTIRDERLEWNHAWSGGSVARTLPAVTFSYFFNSPTILYRRA